jgi:GxxExxY protein
LEPQHERDPKTHAIIGAAMEVHQHLGPGLLESAYQEALALELSDRKVPHQREVEVPVRYKGHTLQTKYRADFICFDSVLLELKAIHQLTNVEEAQIVHYLRATGLQLGLLINFGSPSLQFRRFVLSKLSKSAQSV